MHMVVMPGVCRPQLSGVHDHEGATAPPTTVAFKYNGAVLSIKVSDPHHSRPLIIHRLNTTEANFALNNTEPRYPT